MAKNENIDIEGLTAVLLQKYSEYTDDKCEKAAEITKQTGKEMVKAIKDDSPVKTGEYHDGWTVEAEQGKGFTKIIGKNKKKPQLTHILQNGHAKTKGGRVPGVDHISKNEKKYNELLLERVEEVLK